MKLITRDDIQGWAERFDSKGFFPILMSKLVRATTPTSTQVDFPSGSAVFMGGWDGIVKCEAKTAYVPEGVSLWEFGTEANSVIQAERNYVKRTADPLGHDISNRTFVFVTGRVWAGKKNWQLEKIKEGKWKHIEVYDSSDIEQWLEIAEYVLRWFADYLRKAPIDGIDLAEQFWKYWSEYRDIKLNPQVITSGRNKEQEDIFNFLEGAPNITSVKAASKNEAIAFIIASAKLFPSAESERFFSRTLVVHNETAYKSVATNFTSPLILIPTFENKLPMYAAVSNNHHVIVPLGADDEFDKNTITLPIIDRDGQVNSLVSSGFSKYEAEKFSKEAGRNITILKKLIGFPHHSKAKWIEKENFREIIPALLIGRWNETFIGDIELIEKLSGQKYADFLPILTKWKNFEESPLLQIGETWRLTSPLDLWTTLSPFLTKKDFDSIQECYTLAFKSGNPVIEPKNKDDYFTLYNKQRKYSNWSREGLTQSLILVGRFGDGLNIPNLPHSQLWVDNIISDLLDNASGEIWISVDHEMPLISEASPTSFLKAVSNSLSKEKPQIMDLFIEEEGFLHKTSHHTGLLWALEGLAWLPEYLGEAGLILLKLSQLDPGGNLSNRPINSITEIFKPWHYQTLAFYEERMEILKYITDKEKESGWVLLMRMLPQHHGVAHPIHKMRWRFFDKNINLPNPRDKQGETISQVISLLFNLFDNSEKKFSQLIEEVVNLWQYHRNIVLDWAETVYAKVEQKEYTAWETIRNILNHHRSHPDADWALPEVELIRLEQLYEKLKPIDVVNQLVWLFNDHWPAFPEGFVYVKGDYEGRHEKQQNKIDDARSEAATVFIKELGLKKTLELRKQVKEQWALGDALARVIKKQEEVLTVCECLNDDRENIRFIQSFMFRKSILEGFEWIKNLVSDLQQIEFTGKAISNILIPINQTRLLWEFVSSLTNDIQAVYWQNIYPNFYNIPTEDKVWGLEMLMKHGRFFSAIDICSHFVEEFPTNLLAELLKNAATEEASEPPRFKGYDIEIIFEAIDKRKDLEKSILINLEWLYLPLLDSYGTRRNPKVLEEELSRSPEFFVDVLKLIYIPKDKERVKEERKGLSDEAIQNRAKQAYHLLHSWKKIPGLQPDNSIDKTVLMEWINNARKLADEQSRLEVADMHIGQVLAEYPENVAEWPQEIIFQAIEEINTDSIKRNYSSAMFNKRGSSSRGPFDGGEIERGKAYYFEKLANQFKNLYPNVADIFKRLAEGYLLDAKRMDEQATRDRLEY
jgi:hypothetical protein